MASIKSNDKKNNKKKRKHLIGVKEFTFDFLSLVFALVVVLYYGGRCFYYYSAQNQSKNGTVITLDSSILNNNVIVNTGDGFYKSSDGYAFKGKVENNYVLFANRLFRVLSVNDDNTVKLVSNDMVSSFMWGEEDDYSKSNIRIWLSNTEDNNSGIYFNTVPNFKKYLKKTNYTIDVLSDDKIITGKEKYSDSITLLSLNDYIISGGKEGFLNNGKLFYLLGSTSDKSKLYVEEDGSLSNCDKLDSYGIRCVITMKKNTIISQGDGSLSNPYVIDMGNDNNYVDSYVKLGNDIWKVSSNTNGILKMYLNGYISYDGVEVFKKYSDGNNIFNYQDDENIAYYLLNDYYPSLPYKDYLISASYPFGEISNETGYIYSNIYSKNFDGFISLLNLFDYVSNNELNDFYRNNTTSLIGDMQYVTYSNGLVEEGDVRTEKHIVPVISIDSKIIKSGNGKIDNPYVVE